MMRALQAAEGAHPGRRRRSEPLPPHLRVVALLGHLDEAVQEQHLALRKALRAPLL